jgi:putative MATE family efflux protein
VKSVFRNLFKDKKFLKRVLFLALPIVIQQLFLTTLGITDAVMVGAFPNGVAAVNLANTYSNIVGTVIFGITVGIGLYIAQYYGERNYPNIRRSLALMLMICVVISLMFTLVAFVFPKQILGLLSHDTNLIDLSRDYLIIACFSYLPNMLTYCFSIGYRNVQRTIVPLVTSIITLFVNIGLNAILINGYLGFPKMGLQGAAIATVISASVAFLFNFIYAFAAKEVILPKGSDFKEALDLHFAFPKLIRTLPFLLNETLFSIGAALYVYFFNLYGTDAYSGFSMAENLISIMIIIIIGLGTAVGAMVGECLGRKDFEEAQRLSKNFMALGVLISLFLGLISITLARPLVSIFQEDKTLIIETAVLLMYVFALRISLRVFVVILFSIFRAGGMSKFVMFIDAGVMWGFGITSALFGFYVLHIQEPKDLPWLYLLMQIEPLIRLIISYRAYTKNKWCQNVLRN